MKFTSIHLIWTRLLLLGLLLSILNSQFSTCRAYPPAPATQASVNAGTEPYLYVTPKTLAGWSGSSGGGIGTNSVYTANTCFLSQSLGSVTPIVGDPNNPFLTASNAAANCPTNGTVAVMDGTFHESPNIPYSQSWVFADNTYLDSFTVQPAATNFSITGLATIGLQGQGAGTFPTFTQMYFSNNFSTLRIECKAMLGAWAFSSTNTGSSVVVVARDTFDGAGDFLCGNESGLLVDSQSITNLKLIPAAASALNGSATNKSYVYKGSRRILFALASNTAGNFGYTNCAFYFKTPYLEFNSLNAARGSLPLIGPSQTTIIEGADMAMAAGASQNIAIASKTSGPLTNDVYFINCRLNLGGMFYATTAGNLIRAHFSGCVNNFTNSFSSTVTNISDNTLVDSTWTNASYRQ